MNYDRRHFLAVSAALAVAPAARAQTVPPTVPVQSEKPIADFSSLYSDPSQIPTLAELEDAQLQADAENVVRNNTLGLKRPPENIIRKAAEIIRDAPTRTDPFAVAQYFDIKVRVENPYFLEEKSVEYNPVINEFYSAVNRMGNAQEGMGDCVAWCASFVNWCLSRAQKNRTDTIDALGLPNRSWAAKSFLTWGEDTTTPQIGDIVIVRMGPNSHHVGFYAGPRYNARGMLNGHRFLAGNQGGQEVSSTCATGTSRGSINTQGWGFGKGYTYVFRTHPCLHDKGGLQTA